MPDSRSGLLSLATGRALARRLELQGLARSPRVGRVDGFAAGPRDLRPPDPRAGQAILAGEFHFGGEVLFAGPAGDPWNQASPSRPFAVRLHRFEWLGDLISLGEPGLRDALGLCLEWLRVFGRMNAFSWRAEVMERRVFNLACAGRALATHASDAEIAALAQTLARQARQLLRSADAPHRLAERCAAAAVAGAALAGPEGERLTAEALRRLEAALETAVTPDGVHASRSPEAGMELLFDLLTLDDALSLRGRPPADGLSRAIDRLTAGLRFFTLSDGRLAAFQGGEESKPIRVAAARAHDVEAPNGPPAREARHGGYQRLSGRSILAMVDAGPPAAGDFSVTACGQPAAMEILCGRDRLVINCGWSEIALGPAALRLAGGGSTAAVGDGVIGEPLGGFAGRALGARLVGGVTALDVNRRESDEGVWLEISHGGWIAKTGLTHERRLYLDKLRDELRGEDRFIPADGAGPQNLPVALHFHLHPDVRASLARDQRSVLLRGPSNVGWWLRNDASEVTVEPSVSFQDGAPRRTTQIVLRGRLRADRGGRVRWKLSAMDAAGG